MPDPSRQSLNSSELQSFPKIWCQVTQLNSNTVQGSQELHIHSNLLSEVFLEDSIIYCFIEDNKHI